MDRRDFIKNMARVSILTGLGILTGVLVLKNKGYDTCEFQFICNGCKKLSECKLPEADKYKAINRLK